MFDVEHAMLELKGLMTHTGMFTQAEVGEPKAPPEATDGLFGAVIYSSIDIPVLNLSSPTELHIATLRVYYNMMAPQQEIRLGKAVGGILDQMFKGLTLGGLLRSIDFAGMYGSGVSVKFGYLDVSGKMFRTCDIVVPMIFDNDTQTVAA